MKLEAERLFPTVTHPGLTLWSSPNNSNRRFPRLKCSIRWYISSGFCILPLAGSSETMMSVSTFAWIKCPSVERLTIPFIPIKQCSCNLLAIVIQRLSSLDCFQLQMHFALLSCGEISPMMSSWQIWSAWYMKKLLTFRWASGNDNEVIMIHNAQSSSAETHMFFFLSWWRVDRYLQNPQLATKYPHSQRMISLDLKARSRNLQARQTVPIVWQTLIK